MATTRSITHNGITWGFTSDVTYGQYATGDYWVLGNPLTGVELSSISPSTYLGAQVTTGLASPFNVQYEDRNGSMLNPHFARQRMENDTIQGFHGSGVNNGWSSAKNYQRSANFAILTDSNGSWVNISNTNRKILPVNSSLVSCDSTVPGGVALFGGGQPRTSIKAQAILTCVSADPGVGSFRPAYSIANKTSFITSADLDYNYLANVNASAVSSLMPSSTYFNYLTSALQYPLLAYAKGGYPTFGFDGINNTMCDGYGQPLAAINNTALGYVNTNLLSTANKITITNYLIQRGIDLLGSLENSFLTSSTIGLPGWSNNGGHNNSFEANLIFLAGLLRPGTKKERVKSVLNVCKNARTLVGDNVWARDGQLFTVTNQDYLESTVTGTAAMPAIMNGYSQYSSVANFLTYQTSDIGLIDWRSNPTQFGSYSQRKVWSVDEFRYYCSALPGYNVNDSGHFYVPYKHCCTAITWAPLLFAYKAMGIEALLYNDLQARYYETYFRRQMYGPNAQDGLGSLVGQSQGLYSVGVSSFPLAATISTSGLDALYTANVKHSFLKPRDGSFSSTIPVSGVQSWGIPTVSSIYLEASTTFRAGTTNTVYCRGVSGYTSSDFMTLYIGSESAIVDNPIKILGVDLYLSSTESAYGFTINTGASTAFVNLPIIAGANGTFILQAVFVRAVNGALEVRATNALKVTII